jgi:hypothetical protein
MTTMTNATANTNSNSKSPNSTSLRADSSGMTSKMKSNSNFPCNSETRGFLHSATHKGVSGFGQNDASCEMEGKTTADPFGMTTKRRKAKKAKTT